MFLIDLKASQTHFASTSQITLQKAINVYCPSSRNSYSLYLGYSSSRVKFIFCPFLLVLINSTVSFMYPLFVALFQFVLRIIWSTKYFPDELYIYVRYSSFADLFLSGHHALSTVLYRPITYFDFNLSFLRVCVCWRGVILIKWTYIFNKTRIYVDVRYLEYLWWLGAFLVTK